MQSTRLLHGDENADAYEHYVHGRDRRENFYVWLAHWYRTER